jgi:hypothetical protein
VEAIHLWKRTGAKSRKSSCAPSRPGIPYPVAVIAAPYILHQARNPENSAKSVLPHLPVPLILLPLSRRWGSVRAMRTMLVKSPQRGKGLRLNALSALSPPRYFLITLCRPSPRRVQNRRSAA